MEKVECEATTLFTYSLGEGKSLPFLDLDIQGSDHACRPWKATWPPQEGSAVWNWLASMNPDVLRWRYDSSNPFDRPWRQWTRQALQKEVSVSPRKEAVSRYLAFLTVRELCLSFARMEADPTKRYAL